MARLENVDYEELRWALDVIWHNLELAKSDESKTQPSSPLPSAAGGIKPQDLEAIRPALELLSEAAMDNDIKEMAAKIRAALPPAKNNETH